MIIIRWAVDCCIDIANLSILRATEAGLYSCYNICLVFVVTMMYKQKVYISGYPQVE